MAEFRVVTSLSEIPPAKWDSLANPPGHEYNPFVSHAFLSALEQSGSATRKTGWLGQHLLLEDGGELLGLVPCYLKSHSYGEYVFDHAWADAYERAGGSYYPKLQVSVPFTPATGPRLLTRDRKHKEALLNGLEALCRQRGASSAHITFLPESDSNFPGWTCRTDIQFHWTNPGFSTFDDFLESLSSRKRKNIRKERDAVLQSGITFECVTGPAFREHHWDAFFNFYEDTGSRKWGSPYLTREFFSMLGAAMPDDVLLVLAKRNNRYIAGALNLIGSHALFGRNWGAIEHHPFLHFETCYYQAIAFAIERKLQRVEAGAQGQHKLARGYLPHVTYSLHHFADARLGRAVEDYLKRERRSVAHDRDALAEHSPFKAKAEDNDF